MKASQLRLTPEGAVAITPGPGQTVQYDSAAAMMMLQRQQKKRRYRFYPNPATHTRNDGHDHRRG